MGKSKTESITLFAKLGSYLVLMLISPGETVYFSPFTIMYLILLPVIWRVSPRMTTPEEGQDSKVPIEVTEPARYPAPVRSGHLSG